MKERKRAADAALQIFRLQVEDSVLDFLCTALVPELGADVAAGSSCDAHLVLVAVAAVRAFPDEFAGFIFDDADFSITARDASTRKHGTSTTESLSPKKLKTTS